MPVDVCPHRLRGHRDGVGLDGLEVAEAIGRPEATVLAWEAGTAEPTAEDLAALARLYDVAAEDFRGRHADGMQAYIDAVVSHMPPLSDQDIAAVAAILSRGRGDHSGRSNDRPESIYRQT